MNFPASNKLKFVVNAQEVLVQKIPATRKHRPQVIVTVKGQFGTKLLIRRENAWDRFFKKIGLDREPQIQDRSANDKLYFECDDQEAVDQIFVSSNLKGQVLSILDQGFTISIKPKVCVFKKVYSGDGFDNDNFESLAKTLGTFAMALPAFVSTSPRVILFNVIKFLLLTLGYTTAALGILSAIYGSFYPVVEKSQCWKFGLDYLTPAILSAVIFGFGIVRGFATSSQVYLHFIISFCLGAVPLSYFGTQYINGKYDSGNPSSFTVPVSYKYTTRDENSTTYHVALEPWRKGGSIFSFTVGYSTYVNIARRPTKYTVITKPGALGIEWVTNYYKAGDTHTTKTDISWPTRDYSSWYPLPKISDIDSAELTYWQQWVNVIEDGITNRMNVHEQFANSQKPTRIAMIKTEYQKRQKRMLEALSEIQPPKRLKEFHETVIKAGYNQIEFYLEYGTAKEQNEQLKFENISNNPNLKNSNEKLWAAYHQFEALYPQRSKDFNDAIERRLAWFDII